MTVVQNDGTPGAHRIEERTAVDIGQPAAVAARFPVRAQPGGTAI